MSDLFRGWRENVSIEEYHSLQSISSTGLKKILKSPAHFYSDWTDDEPKKKPTEAMRFGNLIHESIQRVYLGGESFDIEPDFGDMRSQKNRDKKKEWQEMMSSSKSLIISQEDALKVEGILNSLAKNRHAAAILSRGKPEVSGFYKDPETGIECRIRPDFINSDYGIIVDYKSCMSCTQEDFSKQIWSFRYDFSACMYLHGYEVITGKPADHFIWFAIEKEKPYEIALYMIDESDYESQLLLEKGRRDYRKALEKLKECLSTNHWPGYHEKIRPIGLPRWALKE